MTQHHPELGAPAVEAVRAELRRVVDLLVDRVRGLPLSRLERPRRDEGTPPADHLRAGAQQLADLAADAEGVPRRALPRLGTHGLGDQFAVVAADALHHADADGLSTVREVVLRVRSTL